MLPHFSYPIPRPLPQRAREEELNLSDSVVICYLSQGLTFFLHCFDIVLLSLQKNCSSRQALVGRLAGDPADHPYRFYLLVYGSADG